jgi:putative transposase
MNTYKRHRFPSDIISYAVSLYYRFNLSHRDIEDLLAERGITATCPWRISTSSYYWQMN